MKRKPKSVNQKKNIIFLTISLLFLAVINSGVLILKDYIVNFYDEALNYRTVVASFGPDEITQSFLDEIKNNELVIDYHFEGNDVSGTIIEDIYSTMEDFRVYKYNNELFGKYTYGVKGDNELGYNDIVIARYYLPDSETLTESETTEYYDAIDLIGKEITIKFRRGNVNKTDKSTIEMKFNVAGVVDTIAYDEFDVAYVNEEMFKFLSEYQRMVYDDEDYIPADERYFLYTSSVKDAVRLQSRLYEIDPDGFFFLAQSESAEIQILAAGVLLIANVILGYIIVSTTFNIVFFVQEDFRKRIREYGIMKAMGYKTKHFIVIFLKQSAFISVTAILTTTVITELIGLALNLYIKYNMNLYWNSLRFGITGEVFAVICVIGIVSPLIGYGIAINKIAHMQSIDALRAKE